MGHKHISILKSKIIKDRKCDGSQDAFDMIDIDISKADNVEQKLVNDKVDDKVCLENLDSSTGKNAIARPA